MPLPDIVFYDGTCALCHGAVRFLLRHDPAGVFRFAPLGGLTARDRLGRNPTLPDSIVVLTSTGDLLTRSDAVTWLLRRLGSPWHGLAAVLRIMPHPLRDGVYGVVARFRYRIFGRKSEMCPVVPPQLRSRFLD